MLFSSYHLEMSYRRKPSPLASTDSAPLGNCEHKDMSYLQKASVCLLEEAEPETGGCWALSKGNSEPKGRLLRAHLVAGATEQRQETKPAPPPIGPGSGGRAGEETVINCQLTGKRVKLWAPSPQSCTQATEVALGQVLRAYWCKPCLDTEERGKMILGRSQR